MKRATILGVLLAMAVLAAHAQSVPELINYQGKLTQPDGSPIADGTYDISFQIYNASTEGDVIWGKTYGVTAANGQFNVILGAFGGTALPAAVNDIVYAFTESERYLGITVETDENGNPLAAPEEIGPRQQILSAPFALEARTAGSVTSPLNRVPPGTILPFGGAADVDEPLGYLPCDGREVSRETYPDLYTAIGDAWGAGDGSTTFNVPDLRGRFMRGQDAGAGRDPDSAGRTASNTAGNTGDSVGSVQADEFRSHVHDGPGNHDHYWRGWRACGSGGRNVRDRNWNAADSLDLSANNDGDHNHGLKGGNETRPLNAYVNYIIRY